MSEHTPLTEAERKMLAKAVGARRVTPVDPIAVAVERILAARTSTATADTVCACSTPGSTHSPSLPTTDTGARDE